MVILPQRGELWLADLSPTQGHEQTGRRPVLIISANEFNAGPATLVFALPITRTDPPEGGLKSRSFILCDSLRSISRERLGAAPWGAVSPATLGKVAYALRILLDL
jgi:mRNA interferase MazF